MRHAALSLVAAVCVLAVACGPAAPAASTSTSASPTGAPTTSTGPSPIGGGASASPSVSPAAAIASPAAAAAPSPVAAGASAAASSLASVQPLPQRARLKLSLNPENISFFAAYWALDKGYFDRAGLDIDYTEFRASSSTQLPLLARGDIDVSAAGPTPALFNQLAQGFDVKLVAPFDVPHQGRVQSGWMNVLKDQADQIKDYSNLRGKTVDALVEGSPNAIMTLEAIRQGGLTVGNDVTVTYRARSASDMFALAQQKAADVINMTEPQATQAEKQGLTVRWKSFYDVVPWYQPAYVAFSSSAIQNNPAAVAKFVEVYLAACRDIDASNGAWTDELLQRVSQRTGVAPDVLQAMGGAPYFDPNGSMSLDGLQRVQQLWLDQAQVKQAVDLNQLVDQRPVTDALNEIGRTNPG